MFEPEELEKFFLNINMNNRYILARAAVAICALFGGNRMKEIYELLYQGNKYLTVDFST